MDLGKYKVFNDIAKSHGWSAEYKEHINTSYSGYASDEDALSAFCSDYYTEFSEELSIVDTHDNTYRITERVLWSTVFKLINKALPHVRASYPDMSRYNYKVVNKEIVVTYDNNIHICRIIISMHNTNTFRKPAVVYDRERNVYYTWLNQKEDGNVILCTIPLYSNYKEETRCEPMKTLAYGAGYITLEDLSNNDFIFEQK